MHLAEVQLKGLYVRFLLEAYSLLALVNCLVKDTVLVKELQK